MSLHPAMVNIDPQKVSQYGNRGKLALAQEDTDALSPQIRGRGFAAIDAAASIMLGAFPEEAHHLQLEDLPEMTSWLILLQLDQKLERVGLDLSTTDEFGTPATLIAEVARLSKLNPILVTAVAIFCEQPNWKQTFPPPGRNRDTDLRMTVVYCYLLHRIAQTFNDEPLKTELPVGQSTFAQMLFDHFEALKKTCNSDKYFSSFERVKQYGATMVWKIYGLRYKNGISGGLLTWLLQQLRGPGLSINILEAMMEDIYMGYCYNAWSAFELMLEPGNQIFKGTGSTRDYIWMRKDGRSSGVLCMCSPFPIIWNNLYSTWMLAFCSRYSDWPFIFTKILNPSVMASYHEVDPGT